MPTPFVLKHYIEGLLYIDKCRQIISNRISFCIICYSLFLSSGCYVGDILLLDLNIDLAPGALTHSPVALNVDYYPYHYSLLSNRDNFTSARADLYRGLEFVKGYDGSTPQTSAQYALLKEMRLLRCREASYRNAQIDASKRMIGERYCTTTKCSKCYSDLIL